MKNKLPKNLNYKRIFILFLIVSAIVILSVILIITGGRKSSKVIPSDKNLEAPVVSCYSEKDKIILKWNNIPGAEKYRIFGTVNGKWKKLGKTEKNTFSVDSQNGKYTLFAVRCVSKNSKNYQSGFIPITAIYTDYTFRSQKRNIAGCGSFCKTGELNSAQQQALLRYVNSYYTSTGSFKVNVNGVFGNDKIKDREVTLFNSVVAVRTRAIEDLSMTRYRFVLNTVSVYEKSKNSISVNILESCNFQFRDIPVISQVYNNEHTFVLTKNKNGQWLVSDHSSECSPFYNFDYDEKNKKDLSLEKALECVKNRQANIGGKAGKDPACDHPYNRDAAKKYMMQWINKRNPDWYAYDAYGGNCMNFASQVMYAGGIHQTDNWFWNDVWDYSPSWITVGGFTDYSANTDNKHLYCDSNANYYTGNVCDLILIGIDDTRSHATVISDIIKNKKGETIDYLLCCNTTNLKNFPAAAYHYTNQHLIRIYGWNN